MANTATTTPKEFSERLPMVPLRWWCLKDDDDYDTFQEGDDDDNYSKEGNDDDSKETDEDNDSEEGS